MQEALSLDRLPQVDQLLGVGAGQLGIARQRSRQLLPGLLELTRSTLAAACLQQRLGVGAALELEDFFTAQHIGLAQIGQQLAQLTPVAQPLIHLSQQFQRGGMRRGHRAHTHERGESALQLPSIDLHLRLRQAHGEIGLAGRLLRGQQILLGGRSVAQRMTGPGRKQVEHEGRFLLLRQLRQNLAGLVPMTLDISDQAVGGALLLGLGLAPLQHGAATAPPHKGRAQQEHQQIQRDAGENDQTNGGPERQLHAGVTIGNQHVARVFAQEAHAQSGQDQHGHCQQEQ